MKKTLLFVIAMMAVVSANAQFEVSASGKAGIKTTGNINSTLSINNTGSSEIELYATGTKKGIHCNVNNNANNNSGWGTAIEGFANDNTSTYRVGVHGAAYNNSAYGGKTYGVLGRAGGSSSNYNYSIFGQLVKTNNGAAIYGTATANDFGITLDQRYAGYFVGPVRVTGVLTVDGNVNALLLSKATNSTSPSINAMLSEDKRGDVSVLLQNIQPHTYYWESYNHNLEHSKTPGRDTSIGSDSIGYVTKTGLIEQQIYAKQHYGISADVLEEVFPDLVYENEDGTKSINYVEMVPILVQAINELSAKVEELEGGSDAKKAATRGTTSLNGMDESLIMLSLGQNKPNPFGTTTSIDVSIPESVQKAFIYVYDLQGKKVEQVDIAARGKQSVQLNAATLSDGMYLYSLIADGKVVETRRMIVEK